MLRSKSREISTQQHLLLFLSLLCFCVFLSFFFFSIFSFAFLLWQTCILQYADWDRRWQTRWWPVLIPRHLGDQYGNEASSPMQHWQCSRGLPSCHAASVLNVLCCWTIGATWGQCWSLGAFIFPLHCLC